MNYSDQILENKAFNLFKQLMYNLAVAICVMLLGVLVLVYGFKFKLYNVESDSQAPFYVKGDMVVVKAQESYEIGEILKFDHNGLPTTHRLIYVMQESGKTYYVFHGDAVNDLDGSEVDYKWEDDSAYVKNLVENENYTISQLSKDATIQCHTFDKIEGKVVVWAKNYGAYFTFIKEHYMLFIALVAGIWCISSVVQNELEMKRSLRLL